MWHGFFFSLGKKECPFRKNKRPMKKYSLLPLFALLLSLSSCEIIGGIFKAGVWSGVILVVVVVGLVIFLLAKLFGGRK